MIKAIFFDLDDTLIWDAKSIKVAFEATCKAAKNKYGLNPIELELAVRDAAKNLYMSYETYPFAQMIGINPFEGLWGEFKDKGEQFKKLREIVPSYRKDAWTLGLKAMGIDDPEFGYTLGEIFPEKRKTAAFLFEDTLNVLEALRNNYRLLLLTNGSPNLQNTKLSLTPQLIPFFEQIVISGDYGKGKPDPGIFQYALSLMSLNKEEVIMVGDNLNTDILGSNQAGIKSVWINRHNKERNETVPVYEISHLKDIYNILPGHL